MKHKRFVLDANIWISYFIKNRALQLARMVVETKITIFSCDELIIEIKRVLSYSHLSAYEINIKEAVRFVKNITVQHDLQYPVKEYIPGDMNDNYLIALALQTGSGYITSGDKHILSQKEILENKYRRLKIITLSEFQKMMKAHL